MKKLVNIMIILKEINSNIAPMLSLFNKVLKNETIVPSGAKWPLLAALFLFPLANYFYPKSGCPSVISMLYIYCQYNISIAQISYANIQFQVQIY